MLRLLFSSHIFGRFSLLWLFFSFCFFGGVGLLGLRWFLLSRLIYFLLWSFSISFRCRFHIFQTYHFGWDRFRPGGVVFLHLRPVYLKLIVAQILTGLTAFFNSNRGDCFTNLFFYFSSFGTLVIIYHCGIVNDSSIA